MTETTTDTTTDVMTGAGSAATQDARAASPTVRAHAPAPGLDAARLRSLLDTGAELPALCDQVVAVEAVPGGGQHWRVLLNGSEVEWEQTAPEGPGPEAPGATAALSFAQTGGDLAELRGDWRLDGGELTLTLAFHLGVDGLAPLLDPIWTQSFQAFADALVRGVATAATPEARTP
jgi:hypothetical protein